MKRFRIIFTGIVQGVGFRYFAKTYADQLHIAGWIKNNWDGSVVAEIQCPYNKVSSFINALKTGNRFADIENIDIEEIPVNEHESDFYIKY